MQDERFDDYVEAALALHGYATTEDVVEAVKKQFLWLAGLADTFVELPLPSELESPSIFFP